MFTQIMVPLDGSALAAGAIRYAERLARSSILPAQQRGATIHLLRVVAPAFMLDPWGVGAYAALAEDTEAEMLRTAAHLDQLRRRADGTGIQVRSTYLTGSLMAGVLEYQRQHGVDLVILASHEQTGPGQLSFASLLHALLRRGPASVCVVPPASDPHCLQHALVPLDGSAGAEAALPLLGQVGPTLV
jgi:nucleotide-binding universal stress UspA family protein